MTRLVIQFMLQKGSINDHHHHHHHYYYYYYYYYYLLTGMQSSKLGM